MRDWESIVRGEGFSDVMRLVHLAMRQTLDNEEAIRAELLKIKKRSYEEELSDLAEASGCSNRRAILGNNESLSELNTQSKAGAESITNTYNYDLALAIIAIRSLDPRANRHRYASKLKTWENNRSTWKDKQIAMDTVLSSKSLAQADFFRFNPELEGTAVLEGPDPAAEPICQGWLNRGEVPGRVATNNPSPFHLNCPHYWRHNPGKVPEGGCPDIWLGE